LTIVANVGTTADDGVVVAVGFDAVGITGEGGNACGSPWRRTCP